MDPLLCLADLDTVVQNATLSRNDHHHLYRCVTVIRAALTAAAKPASPPPSE